MAWSATPVLADEELVTVRNHAGGVDPNHDRPALTGADDMSGRFGRLDR